MLTVMSPSSRIASVSARARARRPDSRAPRPAGSRRRVLAADPQDHAGVVGGGRDRAGMEGATEASVTGSNRSRSYWHSTETAVPASAPAIFSSKSGSCSTPLTGRSAQLMSTASRRPGKPWSRQSVHLSVQPADRLAGAEHLPGQQRPLAARRGHLPGGQRRFHRDPAQGQLGRGPVRRGLAEPDDLQAAGQPVPDERGGEVEQLLGLAERQARVIVHRQISDLRVRADRHLATSLGRMARGRGIDGIGRVGRGERGPAGDEVGGALGDRDRPARWCCPGARTASPTRRPRAGR